MPLLALGHKLALSLLTLMLGGALTTKPRATKRDATDMIRSLGFGGDHSAGPQPVDSAAVQLIKQGPEYDILEQEQENRYYDCPSVCVCYELMTIFNVSIFITTLFYHTCDRHLPRSVTSWWALALTLSVRLTAISNSRSLSAPVGSSSTHVICVACS